MTRKFLSFALASVLGCGIALGADSNYTTEGKEKVTRNGVNIFLEPNSPYKNEFLSGKMDKALEAMKKSFEKMKNKPSPKAPAPAVSDVQILEIQSTDGGYEYVFGKTTTDLNHGGSLFQVGTGVTGYGGNSYDSATFAGNQAVQLDSIGMDLTGDNIVDGFYDIWDISRPSNSNGDFVFTSRSINPGPTMSTKIYIK